MSLELISHPLCPYVHRAAALLTELDVPFTARFVDLQAKPDWFLAISPRGKVPVLVVDGAPIFESNVILEYLAERFAPELVLPDLLARARRRMWIELTNDLMPGHYKIAVAKTPSERAAAIRSAHEMLARFEPEIAGRYFAGDAPGLVDFAAGPALFRLEKVQQLLGIEVYSDLPRVAAWAREIAGRPAFLQALAPEFEERFDKLVVRDGVAA